MDLFQKAKAVRLKSVHDKYLTADEDEESVVQDREGTSKSAIWTVEFVENADNIIRLKSCYGKYLTASNQPFLLGMTGRKVLQTLPKRLDSSVEWEPVRQNGAVKLKTRYGQFLRANGGLPPWRNSVTHDIPHRTATQEWVLWELHVVDIVVGNQAPPPPTVAGSNSRKSLSFNRQESRDSYISSPPKSNDGRLVYFKITDENGEIDDSFGEFCITFKGSEVDKLKSSLEDELGVEGITVCARSPLDGRLYPLLLQLPPNNATMHVVVALPSSQVNDDVRNLGVLQ
ncbi:uncharacterized protein LOC127245288 [Andrographis paniculata]|uniref:uncharacterized protein LOC127245288 n=1 Tax=Andrographis paniculata TaxID=175694 RepID=UPI0021E70EA7|nr:uncharacterized protein LOC127245288 [Andrographis paniculata]